jgi:hypothetical protein
VNGYREFREGQPYIQICKAVFFVCAEFYQALALQSKPGEYLSLWCKEKVAGAVIVDPNCCDVLIVKQLVVNY